MSRTDLQLMLLEELLATPGSEAGWSKFLLHVCDALGGSTASFISHDFSSADTSIAINARTDPDAVAAYSAHWHQFDPWAASPLTQRALAGSVAHGDDLIPSDKLRRTAFFNEFAARFGVLCLAGFIEVSTGTLTCLSIVAPPERAPFRKEDAEFLRALLPSVRRAIELHRRLVGAELVNLHSAAVLDGLPHGVLLVSATGRILSTNRVADEILRARDGLSMERGELRGATPEATDHLRKALAAAAHRLPAHTADTIPLLLHRSSGRRPLCALVAPLPRLRRAFVSDDAHVVIFVTDPDRCPVSDPETISRVLGLTPAEARLTYRLAIGLSLKESAGEMGIRVETARTRLKMVFQKTDTHRQSDLVRLVLATSAPGAGRTPSRPPAF